MTKLSDTQAMILSAAVQRPEHIALPLPESLRGGAAAKVVGAMLAKGFLEEVAERAGVVSAEVRSAVELSPQQQERLRERLEQYTGKKVLLEIQVDAGVRGGVVARVGDTVFDGSVNTHLERLRQRLAG